MRSLSSASPDMGLIVVDNGSTDHSVDRIRRVVPQAVVLEMGENLGYVKGINAGISEALNSNPAYILVINNDATVTEPLVVTLIDALERHQKAGIAGPKILYYQSDRIWYGGGKYNSTLGFSTHTEMDEKDSVHEERITDFVTGCTMMVEAEVFREVGLFDEDFWMYVEDLDFCLRARDSGYRCIYVPSAVAHHKVSASMGRRGTNVMTPLRARLYARNMMILAFKRDTWRILPTFIGQLIIRLPYYFLLISLQNVEGALRSYLGGLVEGLNSVVGGEVDI